MEKIEGALQAQKINIYRPGIEQYKLKILIYGDPGAGKTTLASTANNHALTKDALLVNIEGGTLSVSGQIDQVDLVTWKDLDSIFWFLAKGGHKYQTVVIDSLSELQILNLDSIVGGAIDATSSGGKKREDLDDIWQEDYGKSTLQIRREVRRFRDLPMHVIFTCLSKESQDREKNEKVRPALTPRLCSSIEGYVDVVGYLYTQADKETGTLERKLLCQPYEKWSAKDRSPGGKLGLVMDEPTIPKIMDLICGSGNPLPKKAKKGGE